MPNYLIPIVKVVIPVTDPARMQYWCDHYEMKVIKKLADRWQIQVNDPVDLYWLGANLAIPPLDNGLCCHP